MDDERQQQTDDEEQDVEGQGKFRRDESPDPADQPAKGEVPHEEEAEDDGEGRFASDRRLKTRIRSL